MPHELKMEYTLKVLLVTDVDKKNPDKDSEGKMDLETRRAKINTRNTYQRSIQTTSGSGLEP